MRFIGRAVRAFVSPELPAGFLPTQDNHEELNLTPVSPELGKRAGIEPAFLGARCGRISARDFCCPVPCRPREVLRRYGEFHLRSFVIVCIYSCDPMTEIIRAQLFSSAPLSILFRPHQGCTAGLSPTVQRNGQLLSVLSLVEARGIAPRSSELPIEPSSAISRKRGSRAQREPCAPLPMTRPCGSRVRAEVSHDLP